MSVIQRKTPRTVVVLAGQVFAQAPNHMALKEREATSKFYEDKY